MVSRVRGEACTRLRRDGARSNPAKKPAPRGCVRAPATKAGRAALVGASTASLGGVAVANAGHHTAGGAHRASTTTLSTPRLSHSPPVTPTPAFLSERPHGAARGAHGAGVRNKVDQQLRPAHWNVGKVRRSRRVSHARHGPRRDQTGCRTPRTSRALRIEMRWTLEGRGSCEASLANGPPGEASRAIAARCAACLVSLLVSLD